MRKILMLLLFANFAVAQNIFITGENEIIPVPDCRGLYLPFIDSNGFTTWVREDGSYVVTKATAYPNRFYVLNASNQLYYWERIVPGGEPETGIAGIYMPFAGRSTGNINVLLQQTTSDLLAPTIVSNLQVIVTNTLPYNEVSLAQGIDNVGLHTYEIQQDTALSKAHLANIELYNETLKNNTEDIKSNLGILTNSVISRDQQLSNFSSISNALILTGETQFDINGNGKGDTVEYLYEIAIKQVDSLEGRTSADWGRDIWYALENGIQVEVSNFSNVLLQVEGIAELAVDIDSLKQSVDDFAHDQSLRDYESLTNDFRRNEHLYNIEQTLNTLTNTVNTNIYTEPLEFTQYQQGLNEYISSVSNLSAELRSITNNLQVLDLTNNFSRFFGITMPTIGSNSVIDIDINWQSMLSPVYARAGISGSELIGLRTDWSIDLNEYPVFAICRSIAKWVLYLSTVVASFYILRSGIA